MTIAAFEDMNAEDLCSWTSEYVMKFNDIDVMFRSLGVFAHGEKLDIKYDEYCGDYGRYYTAACGHPIFHATLSICKANEFNNVFDVMRSSFVGIFARIVALEVYENPIKLIRRYELTHSK